MTTAHTPTLPILAAWIHKEWRAQRTLLLSALGLNYAAMLAVCGVLLARGKEVADLPLYCFPLATAAIVIVLCIPHTAYHEQAAGHDRFLRRLPGALSRAFTAKLVYLTVALLALTTLGYLFAWLLSALLGAGTPLLWASIDPRESGVANFLTTICLPLAPWLFALSWWLSDGRAAIVVLAFLASVLAWAVHGALKPFHGLIDTISFEPLLWSTIPAAFVVAWFSLGGRRGGDYRRSAKHGAAAMILALTPQVLWLGGLAWQFSDPDLADTVFLRDAYITSDHRAVVVRGHVRRDWYPLTMRIDLATGDAERLGAPGYPVDPLDFVLPHWSVGAGPCDWLFVLEHVDRDDLTGILVDALTGKRTSLRQDDLPGALSQDGLRAFLRARSPFAMPGHRKAWILGERLEWEEEDGSIGSMAMDWGAPRTGAFPAGHGFLLAGAKKQNQMFDLTRRAFVATDLFPNPVGTAVNGLWLITHQHKQDSPWHLFDPDTGDVRALPELGEGRTVLGLIDDEEILLARRKGSRWDVVAFRPRDRRLREIPIPAALHGPIGPAFRAGPYGPRGPDGRFWLRAGASDDRHLVLLDATDGTWEQTPHHSMDILDVAGDGSFWALERERRIVRIDGTTGNKEILFPRSPGS